MIIRGKLSPLGFMVSKFSRGWGSVCVMSKQAQLIHVFVIDSDQFVPSSVFITVFMYNIHLNIYSHCQSISDVERGWVFYFTDPKNFGYSLNCHTKFLSPVGM